MLKRCTISLVAIFSFILPYIVNAQMQMDVPALLSAGLPVVEINTLNSEEPTADPIDHPVGSWGESITNATIVPGRVRVWQTDGIISFDSGNYVEEESGMTVKIRGNTSGRSSKKAYKISLEKKADMLNRGCETKYKDKSWILTREEQTTIHTLIGLKLNALMPMQWTPSFQYVNLLFNHDYRGLYILIENVKRNPSCRIDVDKTTGVILEEDAYWWNEPLFFTSRLSDTQRLYTLKYPKAEEVTREQSERIQEAIYQMETSLFNDTYPDFIDVPSFANWVMAHDFLGTFDHGGSNIFLTRYDDQPSSKFMMGNLWDFDTIERVADDWSPIHYQRSSFFYYLFHSKNKSFVKTYCRLWSTRGHELTKQLIEELEAFFDPVTEEAFNASRRLDAQRWPSFNHYRPIEEDLQEARKYFYSRATWMDEAIATLDTTDVYVNIVNIQNHTPSSTIYNLQGNRLIYHPHGKVYIENRHKVIRIH